MSKVVETTIRELRKSVSLTGDDSYIVKYDPMGFLSVRLLDASGTVPLALYKVAVDVPGEGRVELTANREGRIFHPDVPFQDYQLEVEGDEGMVKVSVPAVAGRDQVQDRHVPSEHQLFVELELRCGDRRLARTKVVLEGGGKSFELTTDDDGRIARGLPLAPASHRLHVGDQEVEIDLPAIRVARVIELPAKEEEEEEPA
jgi:hypothetical protein